MIAKIKRIERISKGNGKLSVNRNSAENKINNKYNVFDSIDDRPNKAAHRRTWISADHSEPKLIEATDSIYRI